VTLDRAHCNAVAEAALAYAAWKRAEEALRFGPPSALIAQQRLLEFVRYNQPRYQVGWFHRELCAKLERFSADVAAQRSPRMLIAAPPRSGKSEIVSRRFPVWHLGRNPHHEVIVATYVQDFANRISRDSRNVRDWAQQWWPTLAPKVNGTDGVEFWETQGGGNYKAAGVGGPIMGGGAHLLIIDDPYKNAKEANSFDIREDRWEWYTQTAYTRLAPGGGILMMATRWNDDDMSGRVIQQFEKLEGWEVVAYPALAEEDELYRKAGEALHPERYNEEYLRRVQIIIGSRAFAALYQQRPSPAAGAMFLREWLTRKRFSWDPQRPPADKKYTEKAISVDATFKGSDGTDYVSMGAWARRDWTEYYRLDQVRGRMSYVELRQALRDFVAKHRPDAVLIETKANGEALLSDLASEIPGLIGRSPDAHGNKVSRATVATPRFEAGEVYLPEDAPWVGDYVEELCAFPQGAHDDMVDDTSQYFLWCQERRLAGGDEELVAFMQNMLEGASEDWSL
jgi:predicted phage terminase large subunit-like protein